MMTKNQVMQSTIKAFKKKEQLELLRRIPSLIRRNGLVNTLAYLEKKNENEIHTCFMKVIKEYEQAEVDTLLLTRLMYQFAIDLHLMVTIQKKEG
ncbi:type III-B CRISPR module-associated protein Cmr5 [Vallitalea pronyensis]|uniref:CRISPR type III-B/RAMP module-associated protein Cmr5 n=1 Tax=Vallitalea pronyensis TaxID=1348613 RepID=A0A8J8MLD1_9FIRM|nr:type III-B CRISPR module-associated protein Cmr5 [Vallitalea pronyensis]QUI23987.1 type III-B CRISPR module-associated protein Cmr5 [Vallitalea pronyensis]